MTLTDKQKDIIKTINLGHERGHLLDLDELLEVLAARIMAPRCRLISRHWPVGLTFAS